jgi:hypothetical protein
MLDHHIQKSIVYKLAFNEALRFSQLKPDDLDNKLFNYHLKLVINAGLVKKDEDGKYSLTAEGRRVGVGVLDKQFTDLDRAHSVLFLIIRRKSDNAWLLFKRKTHPLLGDEGFMHVNPVATEDVFKTAKERLLAKTNLSASFRYLGSGYFKIFEDDGLESYTHFTALVAEDAEGELKQNNDKGEYFWQADIKDIFGELLPTAQALLDQYEADQPFFIEKTFKL